MSSKRKTVLQRPVRQSRHGPFKHSALAIHWILLLFVFSLPQIHAKSVLVIPITFPDLPQMPRSQEELVTEMNTVARFFQAASFGKLSIHFEVVGPLRMPYPSTRYVDTFDLDRIRGDALLAAEAAGVRAINYDHDIMVLPDIGLPLCGYAYSGKGNWVQGHCANAATLAHELGHNLGLPHASGWASPTTIGDGISVDAGTPFDIMGHGYYGDPSGKDIGGHFNMNFKHHLGWVPLESIHTVTSNNTYRIHVSDAGGLIIPNRKYGLRIPIASPVPVGIVDYWVECRSMVPPEVAHDGVFIMWGSTNTLGAFRLLDTTPGSYSGFRDFRDSALQVGRSFTDPQRRLTITPQLRGGSGADTFFDVQILFESSLVPPTILTSPRSITVGKGSTVELQVNAVSTIPINYQWSRYGTALLGATNATLRFASAGLSDTGDYRVTLSNTIGFAASAPVILTVTNPPNNRCVEMPTGLVAWWTADGHPLDSSGTNHGILVQKATIGPGRIGGAFFLGGSGDQVSVPESKTWGFGDGPFTIEVWAKFEANQNGSPWAILASDDGPGLRNKWIFWWNDNRLQFHVNGNAQANLRSTEFSPTPGLWYHLAIVRDENEFAFYVNGTRLSTDTAKITVPETSSPLTIGAAESAFYFKGSIDDVRVYRRALTAQDLSTLYSASDVGMCLGPDAPSQIGFASTNLAVIEGPQSLGVEILRVGNTNASTSIDFYSSDATAIAGIDYVANRGTVVFRPGEVRRTLSFEILSGSLFPQTRHFSVHLQSTSGSTFVSQHAKAAVSIVESSCSPAPRDMLAWWPCDGDTKDIFGSNHAKLTGRGSNFASGKVGAAILFSGSGALEVPDSTLFDFGRTSPMSVCLWGYRMGTQPVMHLVGKRGGCGPPFSYQVAFDTRGLLFGGDSGYALANDQMPMNRWTHLVGTFDGATFRLYIDGALKASAKGTIGQTNSATLKIGGSGECAPFVGMIDEVAIFKRALTDQEIRAIHAAGSVGICPVTTNQRTIASANYNRNTGFSGSFMIRGGERVEVQTTTNLASAQWTTLTNFQSAIDLLFNFTDQTAPDYTMRFYRVSTR